MIFTDENYVSALRWRMAEYQALMRLRKCVKEMVVPQICVPEVEFDFELWQPQKKRATAHLAVSREVPRKMGEPTRLDHAERKNHCWPDERWCPCLRPHRKMCEMPSWPEQLDPMERRESTTAFRWLCVTSPRCPLQPEKQEAPSFREGSRHCARFRRLPPVADATFIRTLEESGLTRSVAEAIAAAVDRRPGPRDDPWMLAYAALLTALHVGGFGWTATQFNAIDGKIDVHGERLVRIETPLSERRPSPQLPP